MSTRVSELTAMQEKMLRTMPEHLRPGIEAEWVRKAALTPEELAEENKEKRRKEISIIQDSLERRARDRCGLFGKQWDNTLESYKIMGITAERHSQLLAIDAARDFAESFPDVQRGLMFWGESGRGKDGMLHAIAMRVLCKKKIFDVRYDYSLDIEGAMREEWGFHNDPDTSVEYRMRNCDLLLIGDLNKILTLESKGVTTENIINTMLRVLNQAAGTGKPIICASSNFGPAEWKKKMPDNLDSRMAEIFDWVEITGPDRRRLR